MAERTHTGVLRTDPDGVLVVRHMLVRVVSEEGAERETVLEDGSLLVGSGPDNDLIVDDRTVSRRHVELSLLARGVRVRDLGSKNGTFYAGSRVESAVLPLPARVRIGGVELELVPRDEPARMAAEERRFGPLVAESWIARRALGALSVAASTDAPILIEGEPGTGKTIAAMAVHEASPRARGPLERVDAGQASVAELRAAARDAEQGSLVVERLDLCDREFADDLIWLLEARERGELDVRVIGTSRTDLRARVEAGALPRALYFHLAAVCVRFAPLRERLEDVPVIARELLERRGVPAAERALPSLDGSELPGNVRELERAIEAALPTNPPIAHAAPEPSLPEDLVRAPYREAKDGFMKEYLAALLERNDGNVSAAAREAGMARNHLTRMLEKHGLKK